MSLGENLSLGSPRRGCGSTMEVGLKISVLFSNSERKVKNVPKYMLRVVSTYLYGCRIDWRRIFSSFIIEVIDPRRDHRFELIYPPVLCLPRRHRPGLYARILTDYEKAENKNIWRRGMALSNADCKSRGLLNSLYGWPNSQYGAHYILGESAAPWPSDGEALAEMKVQCRANGLWNVSRLNKKELAHLLMTI